MDEAGETDERETASERTDRQTDGREAEIKRWKVDVSVKYAGSFAGG